MTEIIERKISITNTDSGHDELIAAVNDSQVGHMPIKLSRNGYDVYLRWSEWGEVSDHIEGCRPAELTLSSDGGYEPCGAGPGLVPYEPLPCVLERGHGTAEQDPTRLLHCDRYGRRW